MIFFSLFLRAVISTAWHVAREETTHAFSEELEKIIKKYINVFSKNFLIFKSDLDPGGLQYGSPTTNCTNKGKTTENPCDQNPQLDSLPAHVQTSTIKTFLIYIACIYQIIKIIHILKYNSESSQNIQIDLENNRNIKVRSGSNNTNQNENEIKEENNAKDTQKNEYEYAETGSSSDMRKGNTTQIKLESDPSSSSSDDEDSNFLNENNCYLMYLEEEDYSDSDDTDFDPNIDENNENSEESNDFASVQSDELATVHNQSDIYDTHTSPLHSWRTQ